MGRVAGDGLDIATLTMGLRRSNPKRENVRLALWTVLGVTLLDIIAAPRYRPAIGAAETSGVPTGIAAAFLQGLEKARGMAKDFKTSPDTRGAA